MLGNARVVAIVVGFLFLLQGCDDRAKQVKIIVPDDFVGEIELRFDKSSDAPGLALEEGAIVIRVPSTGQLTFSESSPFMSWHIMTARRQSGAVLPVSGVDNVVPANDVALRYVGTYRAAPGDTIIERLVVGTVAEQRAANERHMQKIRVQ